MGCCVSSMDKDPPPPLSHHFHRHSSFSKSSKSRAPPPTFDEETVKEVLSETPNPPKLLYSPKPQPDETRKQKPVPVIQEATKHDVTQKPNSIITPTTEVSEDATEICSSTLSESVSTTTFNNDVSGEVFRQRLTGGSPAKYRNRSYSGEVKREKVVGKSPIRGSDHRSPGRIRPVNGRDQPGRVEKYGPVQWSRSPANRTDAGGGSSTRNGVGRSPSVRKTGKSPSRVGSDLHEKTRRGRESTAGTNESLENPLVSLECFIFL